MSGQKTNEKSGEGEDWLLPEENRDHLRGLFAEMREPLSLEVFTKDGQNDSYNEAVVRFMRDLDRLGDKVKVLFHKIGEGRAEKLKVFRSPTILIEPDKYPIRYTGAPLGEEARTFIGTIMLVSRGVSGLSELSLALLSSLDETRHVRVFVSPACPYCPGQAANALKAAIARPGLVSAEVVETGENRELTVKYQAHSVPLTVINETFRQKGFYPEERFILELVGLKPSEELIGKAKAEAGIGEETTEVDVVVVGAGPSGLTAAMYAERSGLKAVVLEKGVVGGQVALTPEVENYPGFKRIGGIQLMELIAGQARQYCQVREGEEVREVKINERIEAVTDRAAYKAKALILATGAASRKLGVPGEKKFFGRGVSVCASCDGWNYKDKNVIMIGGGNTALTEALYLKNIGVNVTVVHRRDSFRAEERLQESLAREGVPALMNTVVKEFIGHETGLTSVRLEDVNTGEQKEMPVSGAFVAIGWIPNSKLAAGIGVKLDEAGYIAADRSMRTNVPRVYACGDVIGGVRQIVTAVGGGATAAVSLFEDISNPYWRK